MNALRWPKFWLGLWIFGMLLGCYLSLRPGSASVPLFPHADKLIHASGYAILAVFAVCLFETRPSRIKALFWLLALGGLIEIAQGLWAVNRSADVWDLLADGFGIALAAAIFWRRNALRHIERLVS